jgi:hypothetical protein
MGTVKQVYEKFSAAYRAIPETISNTVDQTQDVLLDINRDQMLQGRDADGNLLAPTYTNDPYFKTPEAAGRYSKMKYILEVVHRNRIRNAELYGEKPTDVPNLIVTGPFQNNMFIRVTKSSYEIGSTYGDANDINSKYKNRVFGIAPRYKAYYWFNYLRKAIFGLYKK